MSYTPGDPVNSLVSGQHFISIKDKNAHWGEKIADASLFTGGGGNPNAALGVGSSTDNTLPRFDGTGGKQLQGSGVIVSDLNEIEGYRAKVVNDATTSRTLTEADCGEVLRFTGSSPVTVTLPNNLVVGFNCTIIQAGTGKVTVSAASGATVNNRQGFFSTAGQHAVVGLMVTANSGGSSANYNFSGDVAA